MDRSPTEPGIAVGMDTAAAISRASTRAALVSALEQHLRAATGARAVQLMWQADGTLQSLFNTQPTLRLPTLTERLQLLGGSNADGGNTTYVPMVVLGELRGWVALQPTQGDSGALQHLVAQAGTSLALLERQAYQVSASRELAMMDKIGRLLASTLQLDQLLPNLAAVISELVVADLFYIALLDETTDELYFAFLSSPEGRSVPQDRWASDMGLTGQILRSGAPIVTDDYLTECARRHVQPSRPANYGYRHAWLGVPLAHHDRVLGVMVAMCDDPAFRYSESDVHLLSSVAAQAAAAVANAQLYKRVEQQAKQLELINQIGRTISATLDPQEVPALIMQALQDALNVEDGALLIEDHLSGDLLVRFSLQPKAGLRLPRDVGFAGEALRLRSVVIANNVQQDPRLYAPLDRAGPVLTHSVLCAPVAGRQQLRGVLQLRNKRGGPFTAADAQVLEAVAEQAAVALENAELYSHTDSALTAHIADLEQRNHQLTNIVAISNALRSTNDIRDVGRHIVTTIQAMTGSPRVIVGFLESERQQVRVVAQAGLDPAITVPRQEFWMPLNLVEQAIQSAAQIGTVTYRLGQHPIARGFDDCVVLPLRDPNGYLVGLIGLDQGPLAEPLPGALVQELEIIANQAAIAIVNARLANEQEQTVNRLTALNALSLTVTTTQLSTDEIMQMTVGGAIGTTNGLGGGAFVRGRDDTIRRLVLDLPSGSDAALVPWLEPITADYFELVDTEVPPSLKAAGVNSVLIVPVRGAKLTLGSLWIGYSDTLLAPTEREMAVLYAKTAGAVLENLRLFDQVSASHDRLASILASTAEGMVMATAQGRIAAANAAFTRLLGLPSDMGEDRMLRDVFSDPNLAADHRQLRPLNAALEQVAQGSARECEGEITITAPVPRDLAWSVLPIREQVALQQAALLVLRDVTAERQMEKMRQDLSNMIVHDLRAPLTNMMVSIDLLLKQVSGPLTPSQQRIVQIAGASSQQMLDLVNALLDIRRLEQRQLELQQQPVELYEIVESVFERLESIAEDRKLRLSNLSAPLPAVHVDVDLLRRVLQNLVHNAAKFSPRGGMIQISGFVADAQMLPYNHPDGRWLVVDVADNGPGVPESYRTVIFELFSQAPQGRGQGTGLGLAFCKLAIAAHGGTIWIEDGPSGGAIFRFTLPLV